MINVTKTFFPPIEEYITQIEKIWENQWLTNRGALVKELESKLMEYLDLDSIIIMNNGTIPIQIALKLIDGPGEVITTPFSYIATTSAILWEGFVPIFVDIDPEFLTIDENKIEAAITPNTKAILATHVFGNPCNVEKIEEIAQRYKLLVIYDSAHAFGVKYNGKSLFKHGDISTCSFHATKLFHTGEGGALICNNKTYAEKVFYSHNFGHDGPVNFHGLGINGKISELQAAMGLAVFPHLSLIIGMRRDIVEMYNDKLSFKYFRKLKIRENTEWNYSYYPIIFDSEDSLIKAQIKLNQNNIFPRRYFYPSLNKVNFVKGREMPISEDISSKVLCLPLSATLEVKDLELICNIINNL